MGNAVKGGPRGDGRFRRNAAISQPKPEIVALDRALSFESPCNSRPSMVRPCRASRFCRLPSFYRCCRWSRRLRRLINGQRHAGTAMASCRAINSPRITPFRLTPRGLRFRAWRARTGAPGISIRSRNITGTMATGTISAGLAFMAVATMAAPSALAGRGRRSGQSGIAADQGFAATSQQVARMSAAICGTRERNPGYRFAHPNCAGS